MVRETVMVFVMVHNTSWIVSISAEELSMSLRIEYNSVLFSAKRSSTMDQSGDGGGNCDGDGESYTGL